MATLPKKDGGTRTVAIATTIYRLLMELDNEELEAFEATHAFVNDSAKAGASGIIAAEDRALEAEMAHDQGYHTLTMLYDMKIFLIRSTSQSSSSMRPSFSSHSNSSSSP